MQCSPCEHRSVAVLCHVRTEYVHERQRLLTGEEAWRTGRRADSTISTLGEATVVTSADTGDASQSIRNGGKSVQLEGTRYCKAYWEEPLRTGAVARQPTWDLPH